jgi:hypothetical protein
LYRHLLVPLLACCLLGGDAQAAETETDAVVVSYDAATMKLVAKVGDKERTVQLQKNTHVHYPEGNKIKEVSAKDRPAYLKKDVKITLVEEDGKLVEINIRK